MPALVAAAVAAVAPSTAAWGLTLTVGSTVIGTASFATLIGYAATIGGAIAYGQSQANKLKNMSKLTVDQGRSVMARDPLASRRLIYGQVLVTGPVVFMTTSGTKNEWLHMCVALAGHEVEEIGTIYFDNGEEVTLDGSGAATGKYAGKFFCTKHLGTADQLVDGSIQSNVPTEWTADHRLRGIAYLAMSFYYDTDLFPNGVPTVKAMVKGAKVYDPREAGHNSADPTTWTWSANSALCAAHYLNNSKFGRGIAWSRINTTGLISEANICDELVTLADASTEKRYQTNGTTNSDQDARGDLCAAMAGRIIETGGIWSIQAGAYRTPGAMTITDDMIVGAFNVQTRQSMRETFSGVKGTFIAPINEWMPADFPAVKNDTYMADDGGVRRWKDVSYPFITSAATAQRLSKIDLERGRQQIVVSTVLRLDAFKLACGDTVAVTRASLGWSAKLFEVIEWKFQVMDNNGLGVAVTLKETAEAVWDWANGEETTVDLAPNTTLPDPTVVPTPVLTLLTDSTTATIQPDGTVQPRLKASWTTPNNIYVENGGYVEIEFKKTTDTDYTVWSVIRGDALFDYILDVKVGVQYNVRVRFRNQAGVRGAYDTETSSAVVGDTTTPNGVGGTISATARAGFIDLQWTPSTSGTVNEYYIYRSIVSAVAGFALLAQTANSQYQDSSVTAGTTYYYYVVAQSASGIDSPASSVVSAAAIFAPNGVVPSSPTAPAQPGSPVVGTYDATDGSVFAFVTLDIAAMPTGAVWQNLLYRRTGSGDWMVAAQFKNTGSTTIRLDDLSPGVGYDIAMQAWNGAGGSAVVTGTSFTSSTKTAASSLPTSLAAHAPSSTYPASAHYFGATQEYSCVITFVPSTSKDVEAYEFGINVNSGQDPTQAGGFVFASVPAGATQVQYNSILLVAQYLWYRAKNVSGVWTAWTDSGINVNGFLAIPAGTMSSQNASGVAITGGTAVLASERTASLTVAPAAAASPRANLAIFAGTDVKNFTGGSPTENLDVDITDRGFTAKPDWGIIQIYDTNFLGVYDYDTSSTSTNARFVIFSKDGSNLASGNRRYHFILGKY
jgi:hypothetical protein